LTQESRAALEALGVTYIAEPLNDTGSAYGTINRIVAGAWAEAQCTQPYLVVLDTDTVFVAEPSFVRADAGVRPVDVKGAASSGTDDPRDAWWARVCAFGGMELPDLPMLTTTIDRVQIRASYNGGFTVIRRDLGVLRKTRDVFFACLRENLRPNTGVESEVFASTGFVGREASEWWGSSQAALSVAIWSTTRNVHLYDARYNIPLHSLAGPDASWPRVKPILIHYHYLAEPEYQESFRRALKRVGCSSGVRAWIEKRFSMFT